MANTENIWDELLKKQQEQFGLGTNTQEEETLDVEVPKAVIENPVEETAGIVEDAKVDNTVVTPKAEVVTPTPKEDKIADMYAYLQKGGYDKLGTLDEFRQKMESDPEFEDEVGYNLYAVNQANELKQRDQLKEYYKGLKKQGIVKDDQQTFVNNMINDESYRQAVSDNISAYNAKVQKKIDAAKKAKVQSAQTTAPVMAENTENVNGRSEGWGQLNLTPETGLPQIIAERARKTRLENEAKTKTMAQAIEEAKLKELYDVLQGNRKTSEGLTQMSAQLRDRMDYFAITGKELKDDVLDMTQFGVAPTVVRDGNGDVLKGSVNNATRANVQRYEQERVKRENIDRQLEEAKAEEERLMKLVDEVGETTITNFPSQFGVYTNVYNTPDRSAIQASLRQVRERMDALEQEKNGGQRGFFNGLTTTLTDGSTWMFGVDKLYDTKLIYDISKKVERGEELSEYEKLLLDTMYKTQEVQSRLDENSDWLYRAGVVTGNQIPFMAQIYLTKGFGALAELGAEAGTRWAAAYAKKFGQDALVHRIMANTIKGLGVTAGDVAAGFASANTTGLANTANDALQRATGQLVKDEDGNYNFEGAEDLWRAIGKAEVSQTKEFATERFGEHIPGLRKLNVWIAKTGNTGRKLARALSGVAGSSAVRTTSKFLNKAGMQGIVPEIIEEEIGLPIDVAIGDMTWEEALSKKNQWDIVGGMLLSVGAMHGATLTAVGAGKVYNTAQYYKYKNRADKQGRVAAFRLGEDRWNEWKDKIDMTTTEDMNDLWEEVRNDNTLEVQEKRAIFDYINSLTAARAYNLGMLFQSRVAAENPELKPEAITPAEKEKISVISSEDKGYNIDQPKDMNEAKLDLDYQAQRINEILGEELANGIINSTAHVGDIIDQIIGNEKLTDEQRQVAFDYLNAKQVYNGMINRAQDDIDSRIAFNNEKIDQNSNENGIITTATLKDGSPVYVVRGDVFLDQDGNFIKANSSNSIVVRNQITGAIQMIDPSEVASIESSQPADQLKKDSAAQIRMQMAQERAAQIDGTLSFIPGDVYTMSDEQGMPLQVEVVADNGDGSVQVNYNGQPTVMPKEQLQAMNDEYNRQSAIFRNERKQANAGQKTSTQRRAEKLAKQQPVQEVEKEPTALDKVPVDENGQRHYEQAKAGDAYDALVEQLGIEGAAQVATIEKEKARKAFEAATKKIPTGNTTDEVIASARQIAQERAAAEKLFAHWNAIETTPMMRENADRIAQDMIRKAKEAEQSSNSIAKEMNDLYASLQKAKDEEKQPILDKLSDLIRTFAADNGYDCEVLNSIEAFLNAPGIAHRRADYEKQIAGGIITPGYTFQGKIYINTAHCMPEGAETFYDYVEGTLVHEATHVDNKEDDRQVMFLAQAIREGSVKLEEALDIIGRLSGVNTYTEDAANMTAKGQDPAQMVADELLAHLNQERAINGAAADEFTKNDIIIKLANEVYEKRETKRNSGDRSGRSTTNNASANSTVSGSPADNAGESTDEQVRRSDRSSQKSQDEVTPEFVQQDVERMVASEGLSEETAQDLADVGLTMSGTVPMDYNALALKEETGYHTPNEVSLVDDILFSHGTAPAWAQGFLSGKPTKREQRVAEVILNWYDLAAADELTHDYMSYEVYPEGGLNKDGEGPLRENVEYVHTFDLDTTCPRTFQYLYFADEIEKRIGRPMTQNECIQLIEEMRAHGLQIPCVYCYAENKRQALKNYFNNFINFRNNVLAAKSEKAAFAAMYGHTNNDPTKPISKAAQEVLARWRDTSVEFNQYRPTIQELTTDYKDARSAILWTLDYWKKEGAISERDSDNSLIAKLCANYRIDTKKNAPKEDKGRMSSIASIVNDWRYDELEHVPHHNYDAENQANGLLSKRMRNGLTLWDEMKKYGASASSAHNAVRYIPYTNELSKITKDKKDYINGMGGLRMHSTNDFRIDYVGDYFQLIADMAKDGWFGHTYTKSPLMVEIFGNTGYRINMSCAAYDEYERDSKGNIVLEEYIDADGKKQTRKKVARVVMNEDEGFNWEVAKRLREQYPNAGPMMMTTSHAQLQFALDADWIDMIIPFHSSGLPTEVVDMRLWEDAQSVQNESFYNSDDMRAELKEMDFSDEEIEIMKAALAGKKLTKKAQQAIADNDKAGIVAAFLKKSGGASSDDVKAMFFAKHPEIMKPIMYEDGDEMKKLRPHFLPGVTRPVKKRQDIEIPGWATSTAEDPKQREKENLQNYFNLCRKYGVHPRFHGIMVKDKNGNDIPIEKHPGYIKLIKETARMDTIQEAVKFNLDEPNPNLRVRVNENGDIVADPQGIEGELTDINPKTGEHWTPLEYAFYALKEHASIGGYENYNQDINGIIPDFIKNVIEYHEKTGKERPLSWLSPTGRIAWQMQQNAVDAALKSDKELILKPIPYHEYNAKDYKDMDILASHRKVDTKSPQFKNWFGDWENDPENASKVVDENGEPLVVYHGTDNYGFNIFDTSIERNGYNIGSHFGNKGAAETRVNDFKNGDAKGSYAVYLNIKNPWETSDWYFGTDPYAIHETAKVVASHKDNPKIMKLWGRMLKYAPELENLTVDEIASGDGYMEEYLANGRLPFLGQNEPRVQDFFGAIKEIAKEAGFDGIKYWNDVEGNGYSWIAFDPNQIKSATDNNGDFDPNNPDIRFSRRYVTPEQDEEYMRAVKGGSTVVTQRMVDQVAEQAGYTVNGYHGTTNRFYVFDKNKADAEGNWGKGFYFTDNYDDVEENYANNDGPDLTGRIERLAESMELMDGYEDMDYEDRLDAARKELSEGDPRVIDAYLKMENPVKIGGEDETFFDYAENYDEETDEYEDPEGLLLEFVNSLQNVLADVGLDNVDLYPIIEAGYDGLTASELEDVARETIQNEYYADENGDPSAPGEAIRQAFQRMGFDGIIDSRVSEKFKTMSGMYAGTTHMIVFSPSQIKLADPITYDNEGNVIPLSQRFNEDNDDIRFSKRVAKADPFYSNAAKAVEGIKQEKATGDQWIAMLQKAGGLKAEEDKWLGLTDWLKEKQRMYESGQGAKDEKAKEEIRKYIEYCMGLGEPLEDSAGYAKNKIFDYPEEVEGWTQGLVDEVRKEIETGVRKDRKSKTISKQEVMDYISQNAIKVEDVKYAEGYSKAADDAMDAAVKKYGQDLNKAYSFDFDEYSEEMVSFVNDEALAAKIYNKEHDGNIPEDPDKITPEQYETLRHFGDDIVNFIMDVYNASNETKEINGTRLGYTTDGLENKREIALTVPTIEPYNAGDMIHFGDAGDGRAVAWIRFGDATTKEGLGKKTGRSIMDDLERRYHTTDPTKMTPEDAARKYYADFLERGEYGDHDTNISFIKSDMGDKASDTIKEYFRIVNESAKESSKVLVIDEIQSKRHQDGREQGYYDPAKKEEYQSLYKRKEWLEKEAQSYWPQYKKAVEDKDEAKMKEILDRTDEIMSESAAIEDKLLSFSLPTGVPDAPFQKSWHELAMKRMLRYAAENGYDKIAWTTGTQQSERYNLSKVLKEITTQRHNEGEEYVEVGLTTEHGVTTLNVLPDGEIDAVFGANIGISTHGTYLQDVIGKELANEMLETAVSKKANYNLENMQVGGDGMKGFYDQMLPRFMDKYGKKWGVKTGTVELDLPNEADRIMHSVDVTPEMKESVMQGQPMFSRRTKPAPKKTGIGYKVFYKGKDGKLYPPMVANPNGEDTPVGVWLDADAAPVAGQTKTGRNQVKQGGKGTQGGSGKLAYRPGWHLGEIPYALQFNRKDADGNKTLFPKDFVWAEVEYAMDVDYQEEAYKAGINKNGKYQHSYAGLPYLPTDGYYMYRTNPNPQTDPWIITGSMKVNRILDKSEVDEIVRAAGREPQQVEPEVRFAKRSNLTPSQQKQVKSEAFKAWFGDWEKAQRIERLRISDVATITGDEFEISEDPKKSAFEYAKKLQGEYTNADTGMVIQLQRGRKNGGIKEVLQHNYKDIPHLKSVAAIPQIIEKSIYITSEPNLDKKTNPDVVEYQHYVCGLKIGNEDYTVHAIVAVDNKGNRYYDHNLTYIEKEKLLDHINGGAVTEGFGTMPGTKPTTNSEYKVKKLISILQTNSSKVVDENGEPLVVYHGTRNYPFTEFFDGDGLVWTSSRREHSKIYATSEGYSESEKQEIKDQEKEGYIKDMIYPLYVSIKNPLNLGEIEFGCDSDTFEAIANALDMTPERLFKECAKGAGQYTVRDDMEDVPIYNVTRTKKFSELLEKAGYDGVIAIEEAIQPVEDGSGRTIAIPTVTYGVVNSNQIKSATGNNGEFSPTNPDIRYSKRSKGTAGITAGNETAAHEMLQKLGVNGQVHTVEDIPEGVDKDAKGWYDPQTNTVHIVPENCIDANDAKATVLHEAVAHYGLRNIMGQENLDKFLDDLYMNNEPIRNEVNKIISQYGYDYRRATEEYCARMAEQEIPTNVWKRTKAAFKTMLRRAGLKVRLGDNEILYMLWKSKRALNGGDMFDRAADVTKQMELGTGVYYSKKAPVAKGYASAQYEREAASKLLHNREQVQDRMISLDALQNAVAEETGSPILDSENAYLAENRMHGTNKNETEYFDYNYFDPLLGAVNKLMKKAKMSYKQVTDYMMMKHGLERNTEFAMRSATEDLQAKVREQAENAERRRLGIDSMTDPDEIAKAERLVKKAGETAARTVKEQVRKQFLNDADLAALKLDYANGKIDFMEYETERRKIIERYAPGTSAYLATQGDKAGLTQITGEDDDWEQAAFDAVTAVEGKNATECQELWDRTNAATGWTLKKGRDSGRMTKENYDYVNSMFDYYVPLRSWDDTKADEVYEYMNSKRPAFNPTMKKMKGRQSRAENPIAYIGSMAATEVVLGNQNLMKQYFLRMAQAHPTDLLAVSEMWYENKGTVTAPDWQAAVPVITEDMNIDEIHAEIERFNADMQAKQQAGVAKRSRQGLQITYPATYQQQEEHMVKVSVDGKDFVVYVNGNPKAAQAINGTNKVKGSLEAGKKLNQAIGQFLTSKNPSFIPANFIRDMLAAQTQILVKESPEYIAKFYGNIFTFAKMPSLLRKYKAGKLDENNETERCFKEFMENGGETGYVAMLTSDAFKDNIDNKLKKIGGHYPTIRQAWDVFGETVEFYNRAVEDATRFTTYLTSRQSGKSIDKSIDDAKNISLNFNRGGAGGDIKTGVKFIDNIIETIMPNTSTMRNMIVFVNPAIQALQNQAKLIFNHPVRFSAVAIAYIMRGMLQDMLNQLLGGDDDEYWNIPEWVRRNNLIIRIPMTDNFLKIPLSQEFRIWHSFGESVRSVMSGHSNGNPFIDLGESLLGLLPADPTGNGGNPMVSLAPTYLQPLVQVYINENFLGYPIRKENDKYEPEFQRVTIGTPNWLAKASEGLNYLAGGDAHQKGAVESFARKHGGKWGDILVNPSVWNHLLGGYFGGPYTFGSGSIDMAYNWLTGEEVKVSKVPVLSRFVARPVERSQEGKMPEDYYELLDEADETMNHRNKWNKDADKDVEGAEDKVDQIEDSKEFERAEIIRDYKKQIEGLRKELKETDDKEEKADISEEIKELMSDMREELGELEINK